MIKRCMLAEDSDFRARAMPRMVQPKIDGVRAVWLESFTGRSLKPFKNRFATRRFADPRYKGLDGEMTANAPANHPDLCRITTSALGTIVGEPTLKWYVFDFICHDTKDWAYKQRYEILKKRVAELNDPDIHVVPSYWAHDITEVDGLDEYFLSAGFEGTMDKDPEAPYKEGRPTLRQGWNLRIKRFIEEEALVLSLNEGETNLNEAQINERGYTFRTSHQENKVANGLLGSMECQLVSDVAYRGTKLFSAGQSCTISAGNMPHGEREYYIRNPNELIGKTIKFKLFPKGIKDKPRFPTYISIRMEEDYANP